MRYLQLLIFLTLTFTPFINTSAQDDNFTHFRGLELGDEMSDDRMVEMDGDMVQLEYHETEDNLSYYYLENDDLFIGTAKLEMIFYLFDKKGEFKGVQLEGKPKSKDAMLYILKDKYGQSPLYYKNSEVSYRKWITDNKVEVKLFENEHDDFILSIKALSPVLVKTEMNEDVSDF